MKAKARSPKSLLLAAGVSLFAQSAFGQSPPAAPAAAAPGKNKTKKKCHDAYTSRYLFHRNVFLVTSDGVIAPDPISPDAAAAMMEEIRRVTDRPVKYVIYTHNHYD